MTDKLGTATYDPGDNKLRFSPYSRLSKEDYTRIRAAGFIWAPKQEIFVAPMWTPDREDLLLQWCGEIDDEDTSLVERAEERADRFEDYSDKRAKDADQAHAAVNAITDHIPLGQPILVGHHSEKRARKDAERIENGMRRAVRMWETSKYWQERAAGAISHAKYKERPDVRARRIKGIEADKRKQERSRGEAELCFKFWRGECHVTKVSTGEKELLAMTEENKERICKIIGNSGVGYSDLPVMKKEHSDNWWQAWNAWNVLQPDGQRYTACPACTVAQCVEAAQRHYPPLIAHYSRWIAHYENRLAYERAMLAADGGTATDKTGPEKGGACRCWCNPGWSFIQKVNKVSVTVLDNWGNGGADFTRTVPFDKLAAVMTRAQVDEARAAGRLYAENARCFQLSTDPVPTPRPQPAADPKAEEMKAMQETLKAGVRVVSAHQLFPTPTELASRVVELAAIQPAHRVLEPSAGTGALLDPMFNADNTGALFDPDNSRPVGLLQLVEINHDLAKRLRATYVCADVHCADFLECNGDLGKFDRIVMNPPYERGSDITHIKHALTFLKEGGRLVAICANGPRQQEELKPLCDQWIDLPAGSFKSEGTGVNTAMIVINK